MILLFRSFPLRLSISTLWSFAFNCMQCLLFLLQYVKIFLFQLLIVQTLNSSWTQMILLLRAFPLRPPISTFSSLRNCWAVRKNSLMMFRRSMKLSKRLKIKCSWKLELKRKFVEYRNVNKKHFNWHVLKIRYPWKLKFVREMQYWRKRYSSQIVILLTNAP